MLGMNPEVRTTPEELMAIRTARKNGIRFAEQFLEKYAMRGTKEQFDKEFLATFSPKDLTRVHAYRAALIVLRINPDR